MNHSWPSNHLALAAQHPTAKNLKQLCTYLYIHACKWHVRLLLKTISPGRGQMQETSKGVEIALHFYCHFSGRKKIQEDTYISSTLMEKLLGARIA